MVNAALLHLKTLKYMEVQEHFLDEPRFEKI